MIIRVRKQPGKYFQAPKAPLNDPRLGCEGIAVLYWLISKPDNWAIVESAIVPAIGTTLGKVRKGIKALKDAGYLHRMGVRNPATGHFLKWEWTLFESPEEGSAAASDQMGLFEQPVTLTNGRKAKKPHSERTAPVVENPLSGEPVSGYPLSGCAQLTRTNVTKNDPTEQRRSSPQGSDRFPPSGGGSVAAVAPSTSSAAASAPADRDVVVVEEEGNSVSSLVASLVEEAGFETDDARRLVEKHGLHRVHRGLLCLRGQRRHVHNRRGLLVKAVEERWVPNSGASTAKMPPRPRALPAPDPVHAEFKARDVALAAMNDEAWSRHLAAVVPTCGEHIRRMIAEGKDPRSIQTIRTQVYRRSVNSDGAQSLQPAGSAGEQS